MNARICLILITLVPTITLAKVDLNESINESAEQQYVLSASSRAHAKQVRKFASAPRQRIVEVEKNNGNFTATTDESLSKYDKESVRFTASYKAQTNRLNAEINNAK